MDTRTVECFPFSGEGDQGEKILAARPIQLAGVNPGRAAAVAQAPDALELSDGWEHWPAMIGDAAHDLLEKAVDGWHG